MVILDTNIIIDHLRQPVQDTALKQIVKKELTQNLAISIITVQELFEGLSTKNPAKKNSMLRTIKPLKKLPYNFKTAQKAGILIRDSKIQIEFADAAIAATCLSYEAKLLTFNKKHFAQIPDIQFYQ